MSEQSILRSMIARLGQSRRDRLAAELDPTYALVDDGDGEKLLAQAVEFAKRLRFYDSDPEISSGDWSSFFPEPDLIPALLDREDGKVPPHLGLFAAFVRLLDHPRREINTLTGRHLEFQFREVLKFSPRPALPDHVYVVIDLKKGTDSVAITPTHEFSAGKDGRGVEIVYRPVREVVVNQGRVESLASLRRDGSRLLFAPVSNSADGFGAPLPAERPDWSPFGSTTLPPAPVGFAFSSPTLRLAEGERTVELSLELGSLDPARHAPAAFASAFRAYFTGPKGWAGPAPLAAKIASDRLILTASLDPTFPPVVDYDVKVHAHAFAAQAPVVQLLLEPGASLAYGDFETLTVGKAKIAVDVRGFASPTLENDVGKLDPKKAFQPFGPQPLVGSSFHVGCDEALSKRLEKLAISLTWLGAPSNLDGWYVDYSNQDRVANGVAAELLYRDRSGRAVTTPLTLMGPGENTVSVLTPDSPPPAPDFIWEDYEPFALAATGTLIGRKIAETRVRFRPTSARPASTPPDPKPGFVTITLLDDFLHADYRKETIKNITERTRKVLNEPYTPTCRGISLDYRAVSDEVDFGTDSLEGFANLDLQFFHVDALGQAREHAYLRHRLDYVSDKRVPLLPPHAGEGELLIGLSGVGPGDGLSLLFQTSPGTADPDVGPADPTWAVLADNHWRSFTEGEAVDDGTRSFRASGVVSLALPPETTADNTILPTGLVWIRAAAASNVRSACRLLAVENNAVEASFYDRDNAPDRLSAPAPPGSVAKLKSPPSSVKGVRQPFAGFGGRPLETDAEMTRRASERLRHRDRCVTAWDYERIVLEAFPEIQLVKCVPHADGVSWFLPGHVLLVVAPAPLGGESTDRLRPRVDEETLARVAEHVTRRAGMGVKVLVKNPRYQRARLDFRVRFLPSRPFAHHRRLLNDALVAHLTPWVGTTDSDVRFGGRISRSAVLDFVERSPDVDFVADFKLLGPDDPEPARDRAELDADAPDVILVSDESHAISEIVDP